MILKTFTIEDIRSWKPCYPPEKKLPEGWIGTALDILRNTDIPTDDAFWVVLREEVLDAKTLRLFAVACARRVQHLMQDERSLKVLDVAEAFANGKATEDELYAAMYAAWYAAGGAAGDAARSAARSAAWYAARSAARHAAWYAARSAAESVERAWQRKHLIEMLGVLK